MVAVTLGDDAGDLDGAEVLLREALQARREKLGDRHKDTLVSINSLGKLLHTQGDLDGAAVLLREATMARFGDLAGDQDCSP